MLVPDGRCIYLLVMTRIGIVQKTETNSICNNQKLILRLKCMNFSRNFEIQTDRPIQTRRPDTVLINKKKICHLVDSAAVSVNHKGKEKKGERLEKYLELARQLKKLGNMKVTVIPIVVGVIGTVPKNLSSSGFCCCVSKPQREREERWKARKIPRTCQTTEKAREHEGDSDTNCGWSHWNSSQEFVI